MKTNCKHHFQESLRILEPSVVIVQGEVFWSSCVRDSFDSVKHLAFEIYEARLDIFDMYVAVFAHPSAGPPKNWGTNDHTPYLRDTVKPSLDWLRKEKLGLV
jgi:uracil-DNA glycosylase